MTIGKDMSMPRTNNVNEGAVRRTEVVDVPNVLKQIIDEATAGTTYVGSAKCGSAEGNEVWQIQRIVVVDSVTTITWAKGDGKFDKIWTNRASYLYR